MIKNQRGIIRLLFSLILVLIGVIAWLFWQNKASNISLKSVKFDSSLCDLFISAGIDDSSVISQQRVEKKSGISKWIEYHREVLLSKDSDFAKVKTQVQSLAAKNGLKFLESKPDENTILLEIREKEKLFSSIVFHFTAPGAEVPAKKKKRKMMALVIDDLGGKPDISEFLALGIPVNFAIMPGERSSKVIVKELTDKKIPFLLHLPMEPEKYPKIDPGKLALLIKMNAAQIASMLKKDLGSIKGASGINNHMGSAFTANEEKMRILLPLIKKEGLFFLDSATTPNSKAKIVADEIGLKNLRNDIFIDLKDEPDFMNKQFETILQKIEKNGQCIAIGHYQRKHMLPVIRENVKKFREKGIEFVYLKELFN